MYAESCGEESVPSYFKLSTGVAYGTFPDVSKLL